MLRCLLRGHADLRVHAVGRVYLRCQTCGRETPGWGPAVPGWQDGIVKPRAIWRRPIARKVRLLRLAKVEKKQA